MAGLQGIIVDANPNPACQDKWAIVIGTTVTGYLLADLPFIQGYTAKFDYAIDLTINGGNPLIGYTYDPNTDTFSAPVPSLAVAKINKIAAFQTAMQTFVNSRYSSDVRMNFIGIYINAQRNLLLNRQAYVAQLFPWQNSVITFAATTIAAINALSTPQDVIAYTWDLSSLISSDPYLSPIAALQIAN